LHPADYKHYLKKHLSSLLALIGIKAVSGPVPPSEKFQIKISKLPKDISARQLRKTTTTKKIPADVRVQLAQDLNGIVPNNILRTKDKDHWFVLNKTFNTLPELFDPEGRNSIALKTIETFYYGLGKKKNDQRANYKQQFFFIRLAKSLFGSRAQDLDLPPPPIILPPEKNLISAYLGERLDRFREIEKSFLEDIEKRFIKDSSKLPPKDTSKVLVDTPSLRAGQIYLSAILFGGLLSKNWALAFPKALENGLHQVDDVLWADLWTGKGCPKQGQDRFLAQMEPTRYRRWISDPTTQYLLYRWIKEDPEGYKSCGELPLIKTLEGYLDHLNICLPAKRSTLKELQTIAGAFASISLPPFITAYAKGLLHSASLPDERWLKVMFGQSVAIPIFSRERKIRPYAQKNFLLSTQLKLRKELCQIISPDQGDQNIPDAKVISDIEMFLENSTHKAFPIVQHLAGWAIFLLQDRDFEDTPHDKRTALKKSSINTYITQIGKILIQAFREKDPAYLDVAELREIFAEIGVELKKSSGTNPKNLGGNEYDETSLEIIRKLNLFHWYLEISYSVPYESIANLIESAKIPLRQSVSAQVILPNEFRELLKIYNFGKPTLSRLDSITCCILILAYRFGLRRKEILGLRIKDILTKYGLEITVMPHRRRGTKSKSGKRNLPEYVSMPEDELAFLISWVLKRQKERNTKLGSYLFTASEVERSMFADNDLVPGIIENIKKITGDEKTVLHHGRHSFYANILLQSVSRDDIPLNTVPTFVKQAEKLPKEYFQAVLGNGKTGRQKLHALAMLSGHADVSTGLFSYFHICDWLLSYFTKHPIAMPQLTEKALHFLAGDIENSGSQPTLAIAKSLCHLAKEIELPHPYQNKIIKEEKTPKTPNANYIPANPWPDFEVVFETLKTDYQAKKYLPKTAREHRALSNTYNQIKNGHGGTRNKLVRVANELAPKIKKECLVCSKPQHTDDFLWFFENTGQTAEKMPGVFLPSRWKQGKENILDYKRWYQKYPGLKIEMTGEKTKFKEGVLRIPLSKGLLSLFMIIQRLPQL
jgi:integrase